MEKLRFVEGIINIVTTGAWGLTIIDLSTDFVNSEQFSIIDDSIKTLFALAGLVYLIFVKIPNDVKMNRLNRENKRLDNDHKRIENEHLEEDENEI